jgi:hypothetical protein
MMKEHCVHAKFLEIEYLSPRQKVREVQDLEKGFSSHLGFRVCTLHISGRCQVSGSEVAVCASCCCTLEPHCICDAEREAAAAAAAAASSGKNAVAVAAAAAAAGGLFTSETFGNDISELCRNIICLK